MKLFGLPHYSRAPFVARCANLLFRSAPVLIVIVLGASCAAGGGTGTTTGKDKPEAKGFVPNQPEVPAGEDDAYFQSKAEQGEVFRVLISDGNYQFRQVSGRDQIRRKRDDNGDRDQLVGYMKFARLYDFTDWKFEALVRVRLNPHSGDIELIKFVPGRTPRAWQVTNFIKNDASRLAFSFPKNRVALRDFRVRYLWRIAKDPKLTPEEARRRAIEFLSKQKK